MTLDYEIPEIVQPIYGKARYKVLYGGRGGSKSWAFSDLAVLEGYKEKRLIVCLRQFQMSIADSVHRLLSESISRLGLDDFYTIHDNKITGRNETEFIFKGLARNINNIKSLEGADIAWVTEAVDVTSEAWKKLIPTIRKPGSEIWLDFNPEEEDDPTYQRFVVNPPKDSIVIKVNWNDNPFFPDELKREMEYDRECNPDDFDNIWGGECKKNTESQIMKGKWEVLEFETPEDEIFYYGSDWGNSGLGDPDTIVRFFIKEGSIYIDHEAYDHVKEIEDYPDFYDTMPGARDYKIRCDSSMNKFRKYLNNRGFNLVNAIKGPGSVEAGIKFLRSFKRIYIHPRCKNTIFEFKNYRYKTDPRTGEVLKQIVDKHNHCIDALRYAAEPLNESSTLSTPRVNIRKLGL